MRPYWYDDIYSVILLGTNGRPSPGVVTLSGHDRFEAWDIQEAKGTSGASTKLNGRPIGPFQATFYLADDRQDGEPDQFDDWEEFKALIDSTVSGPTPKALPIYHPDLARNGFTEVVSGGVGAPIHDGRGGVSVTVKFLEYKPPKPKAVASAKGGSATPGVRQGVTTLSAPDPNAERKARLAALVAQAKEP
jgi:hypothetical protein